MQQPVSRREYRRQCEYAAAESRLDPFLLHSGENDILSGRLSEKQKDDYLFVRNGILRLWTRNPLICVTRQEVLETCTPRKTPVKLALLAFEWLSRHGYINHGCVEITTSFSSSVENKSKTVIIIGAGVSGLACARQIQSLNDQLSHPIKSYEPPNIILLEGRDRIGGRVYSYPISGQQDANLPHKLASTAEVGAQIILGFGGNPLNHIIRGQLALEHQVFSADDTLRLFDTDGSEVQNKERADEMLRLYNSLLDTTMHYSWKAIEQAAVKHLQSHDKHVKGHPNGKTNGQLSVDHVMKGSCQNGANGHVTVLSSLGEMMDDLITTNQEQLSLSPLDLRLINWELANFEYANGASVENISLGGWAQADGNEFEGFHSIIVGGYSQLPRGLMKYPTPLDVRLNKAVSSVRYNIPHSNTTKPATVECEDGSVYEADYVVSTLPLGVLKDNPPQFEPPLPPWKAGAIQRLGFGLLNKVILVFDNAFWDNDLEYFGTLNQSVRPESLNQTDYSAKRGKFFMLFNCMRTSGRPMLVALIAGMIAHSTEEVSDMDIVGDVCRKLKKIFKLEQNPKPAEAIVTRWKQDRFARGSYSYLGPEALPNDYDDMAKPVGNLYFAGEATCGSYAATVHGAYLSGLRAAAQVFDAMAGPVTLERM